MTGAARGEGSTRIPRRARFRAPGSLEQHGIRRHGEQQGDSGEHHAGGEGEPGGQSQKPQQVLHARLPCSGRHWRPRTGATRGAAMATRRAILAKRRQALECALDRLYSPAMSRRIAIVEDDPTIRANYAEALRKHGFEVSAYAARAEALAGLRLGADDYLTKDVSLPHLLARIAALFRRAELAGQPQAAEERLERGALQLDLKRFSVTWRGSAVALTLTEFWMVHALCKFPEHVKTRDQLMREANLVVDEGTITSHVKRIRRKFLAADPRFDAIDTVYGMGYRWKA